MVDAIPRADRVAFSSSGTEATLHAMRIARARTGRDKIAKFEGGYHGVHDSALVSGSLAQPAGSPEDPQSVPDTPGIPDGTVEQIVTLSYGNPASLDKIRAMADDLAAVFQGGKGLELPPTLRVSTRSAFHQGFLSYTVNPRSRYCWAVRSVMRSIRFSWGST